MTKHITLINCGGTISSDYDGDTIRAGKVDSFAALGCVSETVSPFCILSENMTDERLDELGDCVQTQARSADGLVITHGTDTLCYTAAYLGLRFADIEKPVLLVSSDFPLSDPRANGHDNLRLAAQVLQSGRAGVFVPYRNKGEQARLHYATRLLELRAFDGALFSPFAKKADEETAQEGNGKRLGAPRITAERFAAGNPQAARVEFVQPYVGYDYTVLAARLRQSGGAAVLAGTHSGTVRTEGENSALALAGLPVFLAGGLEGAKYASLRLLPPSVTVCDNITPVALYEKVRLAYRCFTDEAERLAYIRANTAHEYF